MKAATVVSLTFDDGRADDVTAASLLARYGMRGTFYVNTNAVGTSAYLSWDQLAAMDADGHEIGGHTLDHVDLTRVSPAEARRQIGADRANLTARGFAALSFAYPFGAFDSTAARIVRDCGYASARGAFGLRNITAPRDARPRALPLPVPNPFAILTPHGVQADTPLSALVSYIAHVEDEGGGWVPLVFHRICENCGADTPAPSTSPATFEGLLAWLEPRASRATVVLTVADVMDVRRRQPAVLPRVRTPARSS